MAGSLGRLRTVVSSKPARSSAILFSGNVFSSVLSLGAIILVARRLGPEEFGILGSFNALVLTLVGLTDFGLGTAAIKLVSEDFENEPDRASATMRVIVKLELLTGAVVALAGLLFAPAIAGLLGGSHLLFAVRCAFLAALFGTSAAFVAPFLAAHQMFTKHAALSLVSPALRAAAVLGLLINARLGLDAVVLTYTVVPAVALVAGLAICPRGYLRRTSREVEWASLRRVARFSKWVFLSFVATTISGRLDIFLLLRYRGERSVGYYAAAQQLVSIIPLLVTALTTVLLPIASRLRTREDYESYLRRVTMPACVLCAALLAVLPLGPMLIRLVFGLRFAGSLHAFEILFCGYLFALLANPVGVLTYSLGKPQAAAALNYLQLLISVPLNVFLVPRYGIAGAAWTFLSINAIGFVLANIYVRVQIRSMQ